MAKDKLLFAPIPPRAIADNRLSALDIRVLMAIAVHDRFSNNGVGCTAGHGRLSVLVGCHLKSLSRSIKTLADCGYIGGRANPLNPKSKCYFVIYGDMDQAIFNSAGIGNRAVTHTGNEAVTSNDRIGNETAPEMDGIGNQSVEIPVCDQGDTEYNIFRETVINPVETGNIFSETASNGGNADEAETSQGLWKPVSSGSIGTKLAIYERSLRAGKLTNKASCLRDLLNIESTLDTRDPNYNRARRLLEDFGDVLEAAS